MFAWILWINIFSKKYIAYVYIIKIFISSASDYKIKFKSVPRHEGTVLLVEQEKGPHCNCDFQCLFLENVCFQMRVFVS
jgi:hypothetical protein